jgi:beta-galactosidase
VKGKPVYFGSMFIRKTAQKFFKNYLLQDPYHDILDLPECCEYAIRAKEDKKFFIILNYSDLDQNILVKQKIKNILTDDTLIGNDVFEK